MNSKKWLKRLKRNLSGLSSDEKSRIIEFYKEMIDDRIEEGMTEADALESLGAPEDVAQKIVSEGTVKGEKSPKVRKKRGGVSVWSIIGLTFFWLIFGIPIVAVWGSLVAVVFTLVLCGGVFAFCGAIALSVSIIYMLWQFGAGLTLMGASVLLVGLGLIFIVCFGYLAKYCAIFTKKLFVWAFKGATS